MDESRIGHIHKAHCGYNRNQDGVDVFGMIDRSTSTCFCAIVPHKSHACILPYIQKHVAPGTTIHSEEARVYQILPCLRYTHKTVCDERNFVTVIKHGLPKDWDYAGWDGLVACIHCAKAEYLDGLLL